MTASKAKGYEPQPPLTDREAYWQTVRCRDLSSDVNTKWEVTRNHHFGVRLPGPLGERRCNGCDRTARMLDGGVS